DGASNETYSRIRMGGEFSHFVDSVRLVQRVRDGHGFKDRCGFRFTCIMTRHNIHEAVALVELAAELGVWCVELRHFVKSSAATIGEEDLLCHAPDESDKWMALAGERGRKLGVHVFLPPSFAAMR